MFHIYATSSTGTYFYSRHGALSQHRPTARPVAADEVDYMIEVMQGMCRFTSLGPIYLVADGRPLAEGVRVAR